mmetsp:Transcript_108685/g.307373  ORF Transcript_108685/g.307373 Transcript_108685/m.307373 type:complete len:728 (-) Transcript_108685:431-2614(-)
MVCLAREMDEGRRGAGGRGRGHGHQRRRGARGVREGGVRPQQPQRPPGVHRLGRPPRAQQAHDPRRRREVGHADAPPRGRQERQERPAHLPLSERQETVATASGTQRRKPPSQHPFARDAGRAQGGRTAMLASRAPVHRHGLRMPHKQLLKFRREECSNCMVPPTGNHAPRRASAHQRGLLDPLRRPAAGGLAALPRQAPLRRRAAGGAGRLLVPVLPRRPGRVPGRPLRPRPAAGAVRGQPGGRLLRAALPRGALARRPRGRPAALHRRGPVLHAARVLRHAPAAALGQPYREGFRQGLRLLRGPRRRRGGRGALRADGLALHDDPLQPRRLRPGDLLGDARLVEGRRVPDDVLHLRYQVVVLRAIPRLVPHGRLRGEPWQRARAAPEDTKPAGEGEDEVAGRLVRHLPQLDPAAAPAAGLPRGRHARRLLHGPRRLLATICALHNLQGPQRRVARGARARPPPEQRRALRRPRAKGLRDHGVLPEPRPARGADTEGAPVQEPLLRARGVHRLRRDELQQLQGRRRGEGGRPHAQRAHALPCRRQRGLLAPAEPVLHSRAALPASGGPAGGDLGVREQPEGRVRGVPPGQGHGQGRLGGVREEQLREQRELPRRRAAPREGGGGRGRRPRREHHPGVLQRRALVPQRGAALLEAQGRDQRLAAARPRADPAGGAAEHWQRRLRGLAQPAQVPDDVQGPREAGAQPPGRRRGQRRPAHAVPPGMTDN